MFVEPGVPPITVIYSTHFVFHDYSMKLHPESNDITRLSNHFELSCWLRIVVGEITLNPLVINPRSRFTWLIRTDSSLLYTQPTKHWRRLGCLISQAVLIPSHSIQLSYRLCVSIQGDKCWSGQRMSSSRLLQWMDSSELIMILHRLLRASFEAGRHGALRDQPINLLVHWQGKNRGLYRPTHIWNEYLAALWPDYLPAAHPPKGDVTSPFIERHGGSNSFLLRIRKVRPSNLGHEASPLLGRFYSVRVDK
jgi:hypothetical protein